MLGRKRGSIARVLLVSSRVRLVWPGKNDGAESTIVMSKLATKLGSHRPQLAYTSGGTSCDSSQMSGRAEARVCVWGGWGVRGAMWRELQCRVETV